MSHLDQYELAVKDKPLQAKIKWLIDRLPDFYYQVPFREADYYGASRLISEKLSLPFPLISRSSWVHGWNFQKIWESDQNIPAEILTSNGSIGQACVVQSHELAAYLADRGWNKVVAGGLPFIYTSNSGFERMNGSLLVMPPHVTADTMQDWDEETYVGAIADMKERYSHIVACISGFCVSQGYWTNTFEKYGIPWISGAITHDQNALKRMRALFDSFEYMTTNEIGSHVAYAACAGCKVSLWGPENRRKKSHFANDRFWKKFPDMLDLYLDLGKREQIFERYPFLNCEPHEAALQKEWAGAELGEPCKRSPEEMARLLGWRWKPGQGEEYQRLFMHSFCGRFARHAYAIEAKLRGIIGRQ